MSIHRPGDLPGAANGSLVVEGACNRLGPGAVSGQWNL